ncbi:MAG: signal peptidase II [Roseburia sp.]|nr:signal peptidase II [Roseburia sp.]
MEKYIPIKGKEEEKELLGGRLLLRRYHNKGAMLGAGKKRERLVTALAVTLTALTIPVFLLSLGRRGNHLLRAGLALLLGGAFSNTYDRLTRKYVVDYVSFGVRWEGLRSIVFNISDFCIIIGALLTALGSAD